MTGKIYLLQEDGTLQGLSEQSYTSEELLQTLLEQWACAANAPRPVFGPRSGRIGFAAQAQQYPGLLAGQPYQTRLDPLPADPRVAHPPRDAMEEPKHDG